MASMLTEKKRQDDAKTLSDLETQIINGANLMLGAKANLVTLRAKLQADGDFTQEDIVEVQSVIDLYLTKKSQL